MLRRSEFKKKGQGAFYRNWKMCIAIGFIYTVLVGGTLISFKEEVDIDYRDNFDAININHVDGASNSDIVNEFINGVTGSKPIQNEILSGATRGFLSNISNNVSKTGSFLFGILNAVNQFLFKDRIWPSVIIICGAILSLFYWIFVSKVLEVGEARFYLENRKYTKTKANKLILPYKLKRTFNVAYTMFLKNLKVLLWFPTIIGAVIKNYAYQMVPYILAENPNLKQKDVLKLSSDMMEGYKWEMFKLDLSFLWLGLLGIITANISNLVYTNPYMKATKAEVYMYLRDLAKTRGVLNSSELHDKNLEGNIVLGEYPIYEYMLRETKEKRWLNFNYKRNYSFWDLILLFFIFAIVGWLWEVLFCLFQEGVLVNRGALHGPWLPIYGGGAVAMLVLLKKFRKNPLAYFALSMVVCGVIEYFTSVYLEVVHNLAWWDYTGFFLNINGRVCLEGLMLFGIAGLFVTYIVGPFAASILDKVNKNVKMILCIILMLILAGDFYISGKKPNTGVGVTIDPNSSVKN